MRIKIIALFIFLAFNTTVNAQKKHTISGYVKDAKSGESLYGATVYVKSLGKGVVTNQYGFYSLTLPKGKYKIKTSFIGYEDFSKELNLNKDIKLNIELLPKVFMTKTVVVKSERVDKNVKSVQMSAVKIPVSEIKEIPVLFGEVDVLKTIQLLPGVQSGGEGSTGFYVRGGGPDQNLIILDEAAVYNASHLFGFFSVFNGDAVKDVNLIKGGMPAKYGGRLSSVLDITMKEGNMKEYHTQGGIGLIASRLTIEGPIKKDTSSFIISGRRTYADLLLKSFLPDDKPAKNMGYYFYDLNTKINYKFSDKNRLYLSGYFGRDVFAFKSKKSGFDAKIPWGNATTTIRWNHLFTNKLFMNLTGIYTDYHFSFGAVQDDFEMKLFSGITDASLKADFTYLPNIRHKINFGGQYIFHDFKPQSLSARVGETEIDMSGIKDQYANEFALYISDDFDLTEKLKLQVGLRPTLFQQLGPYDRYVLGPLGEPKDTIHYGFFENVVTYARAEPRFSLRYTLNEKSSLKASYTQNYQYVHLATLSGASMPTDMWVPSSTRVKPQFSVQYAAGYFRNFLNNNVETSVEAYYKHMYHQIEYKDGSYPGENVGQNEDNSFVFGQGESFGIEFFVKKIEGRFTGWIGYTLSKTTKFFPDLNEGKPFPAKYDRRHDLSIVTNYKISDRLTASAVFVYATGNAVTLPLAYYIIDYHMVVEYMARNSYRMEPYHRLDLSLTLYPKKKEGRKFESYWNFSIYNVYNHNNPYFIYFDHEGSFYDGTLVTKAYQVSLFPVLPSITWNFKF